MRKRRWRLWIIPTTVNVVLISTLTLANEKSEITKQSFASHEKAAQMSLQSIASTSYSKLITDQEAKLLGFDSADEVKSAELGPPLPVFRVGLKQLGDFMPSDDPEKLLSNANFVIYPIMVGSKVRSSLTVTQSPKDKVWKTTKWGSGPLLRLLWKYRSSPSNFVVWIPALNLYFLGDRSAGRLTLIPIEDVPKQRFMAGQEQPAEKVFSNLRIKAQARGEGPG